MAGVVYAQKPRVKRIDSDAFALLEELALNLRWSWSHAADKIWEELDPVLWKMTQNPWVVVQTVSRDKLEQMLANFDFSQRVQELVEINRTEATADRWFQKNFPSTGLKSIAYFSMEFMLTEALPIYSGGLGNVAGDQLKTASDLGVPVVGVGLLYQQGYFRQIIDSEGNQQALYPYNDPGQLPITPLRKPSGEWLRLEIKFPGYSLWFRTWQVEVGRLKLYLLDSNDPANFPAHRGITSELYGGGTELRLKQELLLGIGGWRLLTALGIQPEVCHLNEGHAAFAVLERARHFMKQTGESFEVALTATRAGNIFTTHTAVPAGFDVFPAPLMHQYLKKYVTQELGITMEDLLALGRLHPKDQSEDFNMAYLAIRGCGGVNAVSKLHEKVSKKIFAPLFPKWPMEEIPIGHVTNGVHMPSWDSIGADNLWTEGCGKHRWLEKTELLEKDIKQIPDLKIWQMRNEARKSLVEFAREKLAQQLEIRGAPPDYVQNALKIFDPHVLTLGFARRFATYKRPDLLLYDPERLLKILTNSQRPVQLVIAGKAHPADKAGQALIQKWMHFIANTEARQHVIFLADYDMLLTEHLVQGVDVWINTPRRPWEACGTSGMKVLVNGGLNCSELDGWWAEAYSPDVGWALGDSTEHDDQYSWDHQESIQLYELLEKEIIPEFYQRDSSGIPVSWVHKIRESMARLTPKYSANRAVREYVERWYIPAAERFLSRSRNQCEMANQLVRIERVIKKQWGELRFDKLTMGSTETENTFEVHVYLNDFDPNWVKVELYANGLRGEPPSIIEMRRVSNIGASTYVYQASIPKTRPSSDYTPRIVPAVPGLAAPLEVSDITWQR